MLVIETWVERKKKVGRSGARVPTLTLGSGGVGGGVRGDERQVKLSFLGGWIGFQSDCGNTFGN